ncbi:MAG: hypothetical protein R3D67_14435 [Hyphomicrobiaceae bacterium]
MQLGSLIARLERENDAGEALSALADIALYARVLQTGSRFDEGPAAYTAGAVTRFAGAAQDAQWLSLMAAMERSHDPGHTFLVHALEWALDHDADVGPASCDCATQHAGQTPEPGHGTCG